MKDKQMIVLVDDEFLEKVDYIERINGYKNKSDTVRKTIEKEYRKEAGLECPYRNGHLCRVDSKVAVCKKVWWQNCEIAMKEKDK